VTFVLIAAVAVDPGRVLAETRAEVPLEAILGNREAFGHWVASFRQAYRSAIDGIDGLRPVGAEVLGSRRIAEGLLVTVGLRYSPESPLLGRTAGGVLAIPDSIDQTRPLAIALHGHEHGQWGSHPDGLFAEGQWPAALVNHGYVVWAPVSMRHSDIGPLARAHGFTSVWVKEISDGLDAVLRADIVSVPKSGMVVLGVSAGGVTGFSLMAYRDDIQAGVFAGAQAPLGFLRDEYRIKGHPDCWEMPMITSYTAVQALIAPRRVQFQLGRHDPFFPDGEAFAPQGDWFPGTPRDVTTDEIGGQLLVLKSLWALEGGEGRVSQHLHDGGHEMDIDAALAFLGSTPTR
jgi:hypothetical protein